MSNEAITLEDESRRSLHRAIHTRDYLLYATPRGVQLYSPAPPHIEFFTRDGLDAFIELLEAGWKEHLELQTAAREKADAK